MKLFPTKQGQHPIRVVYYQGEGGFDLELLWAKVGQTLQGVQATSLTH